MLSTLARLTITIITITEIGNLQKQITNQGESITLPSLTTATSTDSLPIPITTYRYRMPYAICMTPLLLHS